MDKGRKADIEELTNILRNPYSASGAKKQAEESLRTIANESGAVKSMRERLIKAARDGNKEEIKDIHEFVRTHSKYKNG